jgi:hypothetical protein
MHSEKKPIRSIDPDSFRNEVLIGIALFIIVGLFVWLIWDAISKNNLSARDNIFISVFITFLSVLVSWYLGKKDSHREVMKQFKGETTKAYRRVEIAKNSTEKILQMFDSRLGVYKAKDISDKDKDAILEIFRSGIMQLDNLIAHLNASMSDWEDIIPEFIGERKESNRKIAEIREEFNKKLIPLLEEVSKIKKTTEKDDGEKKSELEIIKAKIQALESEKYSEIKQIDPLVTSGATVSGFGGTSVFGQPANSALLSSMGLVDNQNSVYFNSGALRASLGGIASEDGLMHVKSGIGIESGMVSMQDPGTISITGKPIKPKVDNKK